MELKEVLKARLLKVVPFLVVMLWMGNGNCGNLRDDIPDRPPDEVAKKSRVLASQMEACKLVGAVWIDQDDASTGIALDPWTVLTSGHQFRGKKASEVEFVLGANAHAPAVATTHSFPILHPSLSENKEYTSPTIGLDERTNVLDMEGIPLDELGTLSFEAPDFGKKRT